MATLLFYLEDGTTLTHTLDEGATTIGRHPDSVVVLEFNSVSGQHAVIDLSENGCFITDLKSSNGTRVNGVGIEEAQLKDGDRISFGDVQAVYTADASAPKFVRNPEVLPHDTPPQTQRTNYREPPQKRNKKIKRSDYDSGTGCGTAIVVILLFLAAALGGLYMRHYKETQGGNFFEDVANKLGTKLPKVKVEKD